LSGCTLKTLKTGTTPVVVSDGPLGGLRSWRGGLRSNYPRRRLGPSAPDRDDVGHSASIPAVPLFIAPRGLSASQLQTGTTVGLTVLKVVSAARALKRSEPMWLKCLGRDQLPKHEWAACTRYDPSFRTIRQGATIRHYRQSLDFSDFSMLSPAV
jgi:hypothetical protein